MSMATISNLSEVDLTFPSGDRVGAKSSGDVPQDDLSNLHVKGWLAQGLIALAETAPAGSSTPEEPAEASAGKRKAASE